jgi:hypothetical protein
MQASAHYFFFFLAAAFFAGAFFFAFAIIPSPPLGYDQRHAISLSGSGVFSQHLFTTF